MRGRSDKSATPKDFLQNKKELLKIINAEDENKAENMGIFIE